ncbi:MAG: DEAD/DEAH box helicase [Bacteroidetes bacterium]|nr:MAG: DEAD/DEAH box helicase [Bacteroidota bacterium]
MAVVEIEQKFLNMELVFVLTIHPVLGYLIEAYAVGRTPKNQFEYGFKKVIKKTYYDYFDNPSTEHIQLMELLNKISDENLHKRFNPTCPKVNKYLETLQPDYIAKHVRTFIDKVLYEVAGYMADKAIPLYFKGEVTDRIKETPIPINSEPAQTCFHFDRLPDKTLYRLEVVYDNAELNLYQKGAVLVSEKPCMLLLGNKLLRFEKEWEGKKLQPFFEKEYIEVPKSSESQFFQKFVQKSILHYPFKASGFEVSIIDKQPLPVLRMEEYWGGGVVLGLYFRYADGAVFRQDDPIKHVVSFKNKADDFSFEKIVRDEAYEKEIVSFLKSLHLKKIDGPLFTLSVEADPSDEKPDSINVEKQLVATIDWFNQFHETLKKKGIRSEKSIFNKQFHSGTYTLSLEAEQKNDWFDLHGTVKFGEIEVPFVNLSDHILNGNREYKLPDGSIALIPEEWMSKYQDIFLFSQKKGNSIRVKKFHYSLLTSAVDSGIKLPGIDNENKVKEHAVPVEVNATLRGYQQQGYNWMMYLRSNGLGGCLADDMGLGKTLQALSVLAYTHLVDASPVPELEIETQLEASKIAPPQLDIFESISQTEAKHKRSHTSASLVIMPLSLVHNWHEEARRFVPGLKVMQHTGINRTADTTVFNKFDVVLTTYGTVRNDVDLLEKYTFRYIILDESQIIKNASSRIFSAIKKLQADHRLVLTGTPVENSLTDLWSQFSFMNPGMLGSLNFFKKAFVVPIEKKSDETVSQKLQNLIQPFILRRTKNQVAKELPPMTEIVHYCEMTHEQESYYETRKSEIRNAILENVHLKGEDKSRFFVLSGLTKLRLIANHPRIVDNEYAFESGKYNEITRNIGKLLDENHKVLIFSQFVKHLNLFADEFSEQKTPFRLLTGKLQEKAREEVVRSFQQDELVRLFLISLRAGGLGLNLTQADYVFMLDPWWNPAIEKQAINRAHRIGQDKNVIVYKFITRNTVEEKILKLQQRKSSLAGMFINDNNPLKSLSFEELHELL